MSTSVVPKSIIPQGIVTRAWQFLGAVCAVVALWFALDFTRAKILCERFWAPGSDFSLTQLQAKSGDVVIGLGDPVTLEIAEQGRTTETARIYLRSPKGRDEVVELARTVAPGSGFVYNQSDVTESFDYRARAGDGQTAWHHVTVIERPKITQSRLRIVAPAYSHLAAIEEATLPHQVRALEGSRMELSFQADQPLAALALKFSDGKNQTLTESLDHTYKFQTTLSNSFAFTTVLTNQHHLDALEKPACDIIVYRDEPPAVTVSSPTNEITARADDKLKIDFEAQDDFGLAKAELVVTVKGDTNSTTKIIPIPLTKDEVGAKVIRKQVELDLAQFHLKQDQELTYVVRVTDTKENLGLSNPSENDSKAQAELAESQNSPDGKPSDKPGSDKNADKKSQAAANQAQKKAQSESAHSKLASAKSPASNSEPKPAPEGSTPPPNDMATRGLDVAQSSTCQPMKVLVDEWSRSFEGQMREKQEMAIDPTLKLLDELLGKAKGLTDSTIAAGQAPGGLTDQQSPTLETAKGHLREADQAVTDLKSKSQDTPYAFIGLQVHDLREAHLTPARQRLGEVTLEADKTKDDLGSLTQASFHIQMARQKLADLTKSYEAVKRDYKVADAMQRLKKMHQLFIEDTQAMLGSKKPILNPQDRQVAEVSDEFADKLNKLLEEKKKIMAELAKILADDPRMLRRFLAMEELEGTNLRDQMTLLARRQQSLSTQLTQWVNADETNRQAIVKSVLDSYAAEQNDVSALASKMYENMLTWLPLDVSPDAEQIVKCRELAADVSRFAAEAAKQTSPETIKAGLESARKSLDQLRELHANLPSLELIPETSQKMALFEANRFTEVEDLVTRQSGWIKKMDAIRTGDFPQAAEVDQHRLSLDTTTLAEKMDSSATAVSSLSPEISAKASELNDTVHKEIVTEQSGATAALSRKIIKEAATHETQATAAFARAETQFDELLRLIIAKLDSAPPPTDPGGNKSLEDMLAMLQEEKKAAEGLGIPCRPINVSIMKDWEKPGSSSSSGQGRAQARAAQKQAKDASEMTKHTGDKAKELAKIKASELAGPEIAGNVSGPKKPAKSWNTIVSKLGDEIRQGRDNVPPEQYRQAIEQYFNTISERVPVAPVAAKEETDKK